MDAIITTLLSSIGIGAIIYFSLKVFLGEKFKNMATLQDIGKITHEIEGVKQVFTIQNENLKHELSVLTNKQNVLFNEEKEALVDYLSSWNLWRGGLAIILTDYDENNYSELKSLKLNFKKNFDTVQVSMSRLELFLNNKDIINSVYKLNSDTYEIQKINNQYTRDIYNQYKPIVFYKKAIEGKDEKSPGVIKLKEEIEKHYNNIKPIILRYNETIPQYYTNVRASKKEFIKLSKEYIRKGIS